MALDTSSASYKAAEQLIRTYVLRGDSIEHLRQSYMGSSSPNGMDCHIGGYMPVGERYWSPDYILVYRDINGKEVNQAFKLKEVYDHIRSGQQAMF